MRGCLIRLFLAGLASLVAATLTAAQGSGPARDRSAVATAARDIIGKARYATFVTVDRQGQPQARVVDPFTPEEDWSIWLATNPVTRKAAEIAANPRVSLLYFDAARSSYVTVVGSARLVRDDRERAKRWKDDWKPFYKDANRGPDYVLIKVEPERLEIVSPALGLNNDPTTWRPVMLDLRR
jgi:general stress protein 26